MASLPKEPIELDDYRPVPTRNRCSGFTAARQRTFLTVLMETGCVSDACAAAGISSRTAYRMRARPDAVAFREAWDQAMRLATMRLTTVAYERAIMGTVKEFWRDGQLVATTRTPSDKLLIFLLGHLLPKVDGGQSRLDAHHAVVAELSAAYPAALDRLTDSDVELVEIQSRDFFPAHPGDPREDW